VTFPIHVDIDKTILIGISMLVVGVKYRYIVNIFILRIIIDKIIKLYKYSI